MKEKSASRIFLIIIFAAIAAAAFWLNEKDGFSWEPSLEKSQTETAIVTKILDGDTIIIQGGEHVRLLGIDADEPDYPCYGAAKKYLESLILGKTVVLESDNQDLDQYSRKLRYVFLDGQNINIKIVEQGLAIARFYAPNFKYKNEIIAAESAAMAGKTGCKWQNATGGNLLR